jgi:hypothetical protein
MISITDCCECLQDEVDGEDVYGLEVTLPEAVSIDPTELLIIG